MIRRVLVAGFGAFGAVHAAAWRGIPGISVRVFDPDVGARARAIGSGIEPDGVFETLDAALDGADIVDVVSSPATHVEIARAGLRRGLPVLIEKPATPNAHEARALRGLAGPVPVQVGLILRAHPLTLRALGMLGAGDIGRLLSMSGDFSGWKRMRADSDLVENDGVHFLDLMRHFAGSPIVGLDGVAHARLGGPKPDEIRIDTCHGNGIAGELRLGLLRGGEVGDSVVAGAATRKELTLCGDGGILHLDFNRDMLLHGSVSYHADPGGWRPDPGALNRIVLPPSTPAILMQAAFNRFLDCIDHGTPPLCDLTEGAVELAEVCAAIQVASARKPRPPVSVSAATRAPV